MSKKKGPSVNYLDYIPVRCEDYQWQADEDGMVTIFRENKGLFNRAAQKLMKKPKVSQIHLEKMGSFIYPLIDGKTSIYEIGKQLGARFGDEAEPLYPRISSYFKMLHDYGFVYFANETKPHSK